MRLKLNGESRDLPDGLTVSELLERLNLAARRVAVEVNRDVVSRDRYADHRLRDGDVVEIVHFVGGG